MFLNSVSDYISIGTAWLPFAAFFYIIAFAVGLSNPNPLGAEAGVLRVRAGKLRPARTLLLWVVASLIVDIAFRWDAISFLLAFSPLWVLQLWADLSRKEPFSTPENARHTWLALSFGLQLAIAFSAGTSKANGKLELLTNYFSASAAADVADESRLRLLTKTEKGLIFVSSDKELYIRFYDPVAFLKIGKLTLATPKDRGDRLGRFLSDAFKLLQ